MTISRGFWNIETRDRGYFSEFIGQVGAAEACRRLIIEYPYFRFRRGIAYLVEEIEL